jgi:hypothetical protein
MGLNRISDLASCNVSIIPLCTTPIQLKSSLQINLLAPEIFLIFLAHPVCKMWIIQEPKKVALWNKRHFEEKEMESV